jgi:hypothetical protein
MLNKRSVTQQIPNLLQNLKVHQGVCKFPLWLPGMNQINAVHISLPTKCLDVYINLVLHGQPS